MIGASAIPALKTYLNNSDNDLFKRIIISVCLKLVAESYPDTRSKCIDILTEQLKFFKTQKRTLNGVLVRQLMELKAIDSMMVIEKAFATRKVDIQYSCADLFDVRAYFGLKQTAAMDEFNL